MLRVAILSSWHVHAMEYAMRFNNREDAVVTCVWDEEAEKGQKFADQVGVDFEADLDKILAREDVDAVCVNAPTNIHKEVMVKAANAGKHIFTEKILTLTVEDGEEVKAAIEKNNVKFTICFFHEALSHNLLAKKVVDEGLLGQVTYFRVRNAHNGASGDWLPPHFYSKEQCGGGAMIDLGAHPMYLINWLMGKPAEMSAAFTYVTGKEVEDNAVAVMKYDCGKIAVSETGFVTSSSPFSIEIHGTEGSFTITGSEVRLNSRKATSGDYTGTIIPNLPQALNHPVDNFVEGVLNGEELRYGIDKAIDLTAMMVAAYKSHETGQFVKV